MNAPRDWTLLCLSCGAVVGLFHDFLPCTPVYRVPGYLGAQTHHCTQNPVSHPENLLIQQKSENCYSTRKVAGKSSEKARKFQQNFFLLFRPSLVSVFVLFSPPHDPMDVSDDIQTQTVHIFLSNKTICFFIFCQISPFKALLSSCMHFFRNITVPPPLRLSCPVGMPFVI